MFLNIIFPGFLKLVWEQSKLTDEVELDSGLTYLPNDVDRKEEQLMATTRLISMH